MFSRLFCGAGKRTCSERSERNSGTGEFIRGSDRLRSTICCKQQCYAFARWIAQSLAMSAALDFRKCKHLLLSLLAVSCTACMGTRSVQTMPCIVTSPVANQDIKNEPNNFGSFLLALVRTTGLEPAQPCDHKNLNLTRLPIPPCPHNG